jgi:hypothetical protein
VAMVTAAAWASDRQSHNLLAKKAAIGRPSFLAICRELCRWSGFNIRCPPGRGLAHVKSKTPLEAYILLVVLGF